MKTNQDARSDRAGELARTPRSPFFKVCFAAGLAVTGLLGAAVFSSRRPAPPAAAQLAPEREPAPATPPAPYERRTDYQAPAAPAAPPVASAPTDEPNPAEATPERMHAAFVHNIESTGQSTKPWTSKAKRAFDDTLAAVAKQELPGVTWNETRCFEGGCLKEAVYDDLGAFEHVNQAIIENHALALHDWGGIKHRTAPVVRADGHVVATWALMSPET